MSPQKTAYQAYNQAFHTVGKTRQVVMLYDGAVRFLRQAREAMAENRIQERYNLLVRVSDIMMGLQSCLDFDQGGDVARVLYDFYSSVDARVLTLHRTNDVKLCDQLIEELKEMRGIWDAIDRGETEARAAEKFSIQKQGLTAIGEEVILHEPRREMQEKPPPASPLPISSDITV